MSFSPQNGFPSLITEQEAWPKLHNPKKTCQRNGVLSTSDGVKSCFIAEVRAWGVSLSGHCVHDHLVSQRWPTHLLVFRRADAGVFPPEIMKGDSQDSLALPKAPRGLADSGSNPSMAPIPAHSPRAPSSCNTGSSPAVTKLPWDSMVISACLIASPHPPFQSRMNSCLSVTINLSHLDLRGSVQRSSARANLKESRHSPEDSGYRAEGEKLGQSGKYSPGNISKLPTTHPPHTQSLY